jgi:hypothetical protein
MRLFSGLTFGIAVGGRIYPNIDLALHPSPATATLPASIPLICLKATPTQL